MCLFNFIFVLESIQNQIFFSFFAQQDKNVGLK